MKYLNTYRLFENNSDNEYYQEVGIEYIHSILINNLIDPSDKIVNDITKIVDKSSCHISGIRKVGFGGAFYIEVGFIKSALYNEFNIYCMDDEWFIVSYYSWTTGGGKCTSNYYKCDQLGGVQQLLKDKGAIK